jgi:ABC-2 type transport system permease protein
MTPMVDFYATTMKLSAARWLQYRARSFLLQVAMAFEAVVYLALWGTVAATGGMAGWTVGEVSAYYIVWTLVRQMTTTHTPDEFERRIRTGQFSTHLLRPIHPLHYDLADGAGAKLVMLVLWLPIGIVLTLAFHPEMTLSAVKVAAFALACCAGFLIRSLYLWLLGMLAFWTTRVTAAFALLLSLELLLSGRFIPVPLLPDWLRLITDLLPFRWVFGFPIETMATDMAPTQLMAGLATQLLWIGIGAAAVALAWPRALRRYSAVGN